MTIYYGLNVGKAMKDIGNQRVALANLGLRAENLDIIRQLSEYISRDEFHQLSGLVDNQLKYLEGFTLAGEEASFQAANMPKIDLTQEYNYDINNRLIAGTIKYNYTDFNGDDGNGNPAWVSKGADISTSRVSSWSPFGPADNPDQLISYGSDVVNNGEFLALTSLGITTKPERRRFLSETATTKIRLNINGEPADVLAMRGIPFTLRLNVAQPNFRVLISQPALLTASGDRVPVTIVRADADTGEEILGNNGNAIIEKDPRSITLLSRLYTDFFNQATISGELTENSEPKLEDYKIYYNPDKIGGLRLYSQGISELPNVVMENMLEFHSYKNPFEYMPDFRKLAPRLKYLYMAYSPLYLSENYAGTSINSYDGSVYDGTLRNNIDRIPSSIEYLNLSASISGDGSTMNFERFTKLQNIRFQNYGRATVTYGLCLPKTADAATRCNFNPSDSNAFNSNTGVITSTQKVGLHGFSDNDLVRYECKVGPISNPESAIDITGVLGTAISPLVDGTNYRVESLSPTTFRLKNTDGTAITYSGNLGTGTLHTVSKWDDVNDKMYLEPNFGVESYESTTVSRYGRGSQNNEDARYLPNSIMNSTNLDTLTLSTMQNGFGNCDYRYYDDTDNATRAKSNADRALKLRTPKLETLTLLTTNFGIPDLSATTNPGWEDTLRNVFISRPGYSFENGGPVFTDPIKNGTVLQSDENRSLAATKFEGLNSLQRLSLHSIGSWNTRYHFPSDNNIHNILKNKPALYRLSFASNQTFPISFVDDIFTNTTNFKELYYLAPSANYAVTRSPDFASEGDSIGDYGKGNILPERNFMGSNAEDALGIRGPNGSNRTGLAFEPIYDKVTSINWKDEWSLTAFQETGQPGGTREIKLGSFSKLSFFKFRGAIKGKIPSPHGAGKLTEYNIDGTIMGTYFYSAKKASIIDQKRSTDIEGTLNADKYYSMFRQYYSGDFPVDYQMIKDMGWDHTDVNSDFCPWMDSDSRTSPSRTNSQGEYLPRSTDVFEYQYMSVNDMTGGDIYYIMETGNTTLAQWEELGFDAGEGPPQPGGMFQASYDASNRFDTRYVHLNNIDVGDEVRLTRVGSSTSSALQNVSNQSPSTVYGSTFNITRKSGSYNNSATILEKTRSDQNRVDYGTGRVALHRKFAGGYTRGGVEFDTGTSDITGIGSLKKFKIGSTSLSGQFPKITQEVIANSPTGNKVMEELYVVANKFTGSVPDCTGIESVKKINIANNEFSSHVRNTWNTITACTEIRARGNNLNAAAAITIIQDLYDLWVSTGGESAARAGMYVDLEGQTPGPGIPRCSLAALIENDRSLGSPEDSALNKYETLIKHWTIKLDIDLYQ